MNYHQTKFSPNRKQTPEEAARHRQERIIRMTMLLEQARKEGNRKAVDEYEFVIARL